MKKKIIIMLSVVAIFFLGFVVWYNAPIDLISLEHNDVLEIVIFNGNTGKTTHITEKKQIQHIIENLNDVELKEVNHPLDIQVIALRRRFIYLMVMKQMAGIILLSTQMIQLEKIHSFILS